MLVKLARQTSAIRFVLLVPGTDRMLGNRNKKAFELKPASFRKRIDLLDDLTQEPLIDHNAQDFFGLVVSVGQLVE